MSGCVCEACGVTFSIEDRKIGICKLLACTIFIKRFVYIQGYRCKMCHHVGPTYCLWDGLKDRYSYVPIKRIQTIIEELE